MTTIPVGPDGTESRLRSKIRTRDAFWVAMHANQLTVPLPTVRNLVDERFPAWRELPIREVVSHGTVNALFRIGDRLLARFPLEPGDVESARRWLQSEAQAARELLGRTRFPTPEPVALGESGAGYPASLVGADMAAGDGGHRRGPGRIGRVCT